jgi:hypothetical protein
MLLGKAGLLDSSEKMTSPLRQHASAVKPANTAAGGSKVHGSDYFFVKSSIPRPSGNAADVADIRKRVQGVQKQIKVNQDMLIPGMAHGILPTVKEKRRKSQMQCAQPNY